MITFYGHDTINSLKVLMLLMEADLPFKFNPINIRKGDQKTADFLAINPAGKVPVIADCGVVISESNAILLQLANKTGWGHYAENHDQILPWLFYQASTQGPFFGQVEYWSFLSPNPNPDTLAHCKSIAQRVISHLDDTLTNHPYCTGETYSIADIALFPWINKHTHLGLSLDTAEHVQRWLGEIHARPGTQKTFEFLKPYRLPPLSRG
ncbi:MAG: glutathione S-transferase family protein [Cognatishimia sp.]